MKLISFTVPCYNSQAYMQTCIDSLLPGGEDIEIIIVDDGSTDDTAKIADEYAERYPSVVRVIHQVNGGHGDAVNTGLKAATGRYFKVVDSDDWLDPEAYEKLLERLKELTENRQQVDMFICNFMYDKVGKKKKRIMHYGSFFPKDRIFTWKDVRHVRKGQYILMHSVIYRTRMLKESGLKLPKHTFYVDNLFVYHPFPYVKKLYYMDITLYHYYIGREDQSIHENVMVGRLDQQLRVNYLMIDDLQLSDPNAAPAKCRACMYSYLEIIMVVSSILSILTGTEEGLQKREDLWEYLKEVDPITWKKMRYGIMGRVMNLEGASGRKLSVLAYRIANKLTGFN